MPGKQHQVPFEYWGHLVHTIGEKCGGDIVTYTISDSPNLQIVTTMLEHNSVLRPVHYLKERHLTNNEISYCCLLAIGLKGKEIGTYINVRRHYSTSSTIRKKLGMDSHETNLSLKIKELLKESSANTKTATQWWLGQRWSEWSNTEVSEVKHILNASSTKNLWSKLQPAGRMDIKRQGDRFGNDLATLSCLAVYVRAKRFPR
mgnify:CR=1 FL=1